MDRDEAMQALRAAAPATDAEVSRRVGQRTLDVLREGITMTSTTEAPVTTPPTRRRRHLTRGAVAGLAATALAGGGAAAWAAYTAGHETTGIACVRKDNDAIIPAVSGDPVADCTAMWRREDVAVPDGLKAYDNGRGIVVRLDGTVPSGMKALPGGVVQDSAVIELDASLQDQVDGLRSGCRDATGATTFVTAELARLRLTGWTVVVDRSRPPTASQCAYPIVEGGKRTVTLIAGPPAGQGAPEPQFVAALRDRISKACVPLGRARQIVQQAATATGNVADGLQVTALADPTASCTRVDAVVGGAWMVTLHGPETVRK
ncbi:MAG TPA: hypothetical protein VFK66_05035 [Oryzihumus sp.]|nr:hypothetical protein [Oryzihumus sp.]